MIEVVVVVVVCRRGGPRFRGSGRDTPPIGELPVRYVFS
jgi:hypothetical protein